MRNFITIIFAATLLINSGCSKFVSNFVNEYDSAGCKIEGEREPKSAIDYVKRADKHKENHQSDCQFYACQQAVKLDEKDSRVYLCRGQAFYDYKKDYPNAIKDLTISIEMQPTGGDAHSAYYVRGLSYEKEEQLDKALEDYQKAFAEEKADSIVKPYLKLTIAQVYLKQKKLDLALTAINEAIEQKSDASIFYFTRARIYMGQGKTELSVADDLKANNLRAKELKESGK